MCEYLDPGTGMGHDQLTEPLHIWLCKITALQQGAKVLNQSGMVQDAN